MGRVQPSVISTPPCSLSPSATPKSCSTSGIGAGDLLVAGGRGPPSLHSLARPEEEKQAKSVGLPRVCIRRVTLVGARVSFSLSNRRRTRLSRPSILETGSGLGHGGRSRHVTPHLSSLVCACVRVTGEIKARRRIFLGRSEPSRRNLRTILSIHNVRTCVCVSV